MSSKAGKGDRPPLLLADEATIVAQAKGFLRISDRWGKSTGGSNHIRSISIYPPAISRNGMWLAIAKAWSGGYKLVAFYRASDPLTALNGILQAAASEKLQWKVDDYADKSR